MSPAQLIQLMFFLFASMGYPAEYASGILGNGALGHSPAFSPCPSVTVGINLLEEGAEVRAGGSAAWLSGMTFTLSPCALGYRSVGFPGRQEVTCHCWEVILTHQIITGGKILESHRGFDVPILY